MKFCQLIKYNERNIFLEKSCKKYSGETITRSFSKKSKSKVPFDQQSKVLCSLFLLYAKFRPLKHNVTKLQTTGFFLE